MTQIPIKVLYNAEMTVEIHGTLLPGLRTSPLGQTSRSLGFTNNLSVVKHEKTIN